MSEFFNHYEIETHNGIKEFSLYQSDILSFEKKTDIIVLSAHIHSYYPREGTVICALEKKLGISVKNLADRPMIDFRDSFGGAWAAKLSDCPFSYLVCVEMTGRSTDKENIDKILNVFFMTLELLDRIDPSISSVIMPLIGAGRQKIAPEIILDKLFQIGSESLARCRHLSHIYIAERSENKIPVINDAMNAVLNRGDCEIRDLFGEESLLPLLNQLRDVVSHLLTEHSVLSGNDTLKELLNVLHLKTCHYFNLAILGRRCCETVLSIIPSHIDHSKNLSGQIGDFMYNHLSSPWIGSYMHVLRTLGNEQAHNQNNNQTPEFPLPVTLEDQKLLIFCMIRVLSFLDKYLTDTNTQETNHE